MNLVISYFLERDYSAAIDLAQGMILEYPGLTAPYRWLAAARGQIGQTDAAYEALCKAIEGSPESFDFYVHSRPPWYRPEDYEHMLDGLRKAGWQG